MTDPTGNTPDRTPDPGAAAHDQTAQTPPAPAAPPAYDDAPYVAPAAPVYDANAYPPPPEPPAYAPPAYAPPAYQTGAYGTPPAPAYGTPVQPAPGAPPVMPYGYGAYASAGRTNGLAVAAMVLSILGFIWVLPFVGSIAGAIMGHISLGQVRRTGESGRGMALTAVIVGWGGLALIVLALLLFVILITATSGSGRFA